MTKAFTHGEFVVAQDPTVKIVGSTKVCVLSGMNVEIIGTGEQKKDIFSYFDFELWDSAADYIMERAKKGDTFIVTESTPRQNRWEKDGVKHSKVIFRVKSFRLIQSQKNTDISSEKFSQVVEAFGGFREVSKLMSLLEKTNEQG